MQRECSRQNWPRGGFCLLAVWVVLLSWPSPPSPSGAVETDHIGVLRSLLDSDFDEIVEHFAGWKRTLTRRLQISTPDEAADFDPELDAPRDTFVQSNTGPGEIEFPAGLRVVSF